MIDLSPLVAAPGPQSLPYFDPAFPDRSLILHAAQAIRLAPRSARRVRPPRGRAQRPRLPRLLAAACRCRRDAGDRNRVPRSAAFPSISGTTLAICTPRTARQSARRAGPLASTRACSPRLRAQGITTTRRYGLFGHSAGGQYVHRMLSFGYREHVAVAVSANAGTYAMPDLASTGPGALARTERHARRSAGSAAFPADHHGRHSGHQDHRPLLSRRDRNR